MIRLSQLRLHVVILSLLGTCFGQEEPRLLSDALSEVFQSQTFSSPSCDGAWSTLTNSTGAPQARHEADYIRVGGLFYLVGGRNSRTLAIYDPEADSWSTGTPAPLEIHHFQGVAVGNEIWLAGVFTGRFPAETPVEHFLIYDTITDTWRDGPDIARPRGAAGVVVDGNKLYLVSGITNGHLSGHVPWLDLYDIEADTWTSLPDAPRARDHFRAVLLDGKIWNAAGRRTARDSEEGVQGNLVAEVDYYDIAAGTWTTLPEASNILTPRAGNAAIAYNQKIVVVGGESNQALAHDEVEALDLLSEEWMTLSPLIVGRHGSGVILYKNQLYTARKRWRP